MSTPLPKRLRRRVRTALLKVAFWGLGFLPRGPGRAVGRWIGRMGWRLDGLGRRRSLEHLAIAFPEESDARREAIARASFEHLGESLLETLWWDRRRQHFPALLTLAEGSKDILDAAVAEGRGVIVVSGHLGNWELGAQAMAAQGYPVTVIGRESHDAGLKRLMDDFRQRGGVRTLYRGGARTGLDILGVLRAGGVLCVLVDQDTRADSVFVPFFGRPAKTPKGQSELAVRRETPVLTAFVHREGDRHVLTIERLPLPATGDRAADVLALCTAMNRAIEAQLSAHPTEWVWFHRRWKTPPAG